MKQLLKALTATILLVAAADIARGDDDSKTERLNTLRQLADGFRFTQQAGDQTVPLTRHRDPVLYYFDAARERAHSGLYLWRRGPRPVALLSITIYPPETARMRRRFEAASLVDEPVSIFVAGAATITLDEETATRRNLTADLVPSPVPRLRLQQLKQLAKRFTAVEDRVRGGRTELRLLAAPIYQSTPEDSLYGCALFAFAHGTNPEVVLSLEVDDSVQPPGWRYSLAAMAFARLSAALDGEQVWLQPRYRPGRADSRPMYTHGKLPDEPAAR